MSATPEKIKELREISGAGLMDCKKALTETGGDIEGAVEWLRKKGLASASKKAGRLASEGVVAVKVGDDFKKATIGEVNCETDFVAQNPGFVEFVNETVSHAYSVSPSDVDGLLASAKGEATFADELSLQISKIGENIVVRRFASIEASGTGVVNGYTHGNGKIGVIIAAACDSDATASHVRDTLKDIAMHIAAMNPPYLSDEQVPAADIAKEEDIAREQLEKEGKGAMADKIIPGKIAKFKKDNCLIHQPFVKDDSKTVAVFLADKAKEVGGTATLTEFIRFEMGEGLEKKACDFAAEVAAQLGQ